MYWKYISKIHSPPPTVTYLYSLMIRGPFTQLPLLSSSTDRGKKKTKNNSQLHTPRPWKNLFWPHQSLPKLFTKGIIMYRETHTNHSIQRGGRGEGRGMGFFLFFLFSFVEKQRKPISHPPNTILHTYVKKKPRKKGFIHPHLPLPWQIVSHWLCWTCHLPKSTSSPIQLQ